MSAAPAPPQALDAERAVLAAMLMDATAIPRAAACLTEGAFYRRAHAIVFRAILGMARARVPVDIVTLTDDLQHSGALAECGGAEGIASLLSADSGGANLEAHARLIRRAHAKRERIDVGRKLAAGTDERSSLELIEHLRRIEEAATGEDDPATRWARSAMRGDELVSAELPALASWLGEGLLPAGELAFLTGHSGVGKTFLAVQIMSALSHGHTFCGLPTMSARVGLVELEMPWQSVQARLRALDPARSTLSRLSVLCEPPGALRVREPEGQRLLITFCEMHRLEVLVIDPFNRIHDDDENSNSDMGHVLEGLHEVRRRTGVSMLVLHHVRKVPSGGPAAPHTRTVALDAGRGSSRLTNDPATVMALDETKGFVRLTFAKVRHAEAPANLYLQRNERGFFDVAEDPSLVRVRRLDDLVGMLERAGSAGVSVDEIAERFGVHRNTARKHLEAVGATQFGSNRRSTRWALGGRPVGEPGFGSPDDELPL